MAKNVRRSKYPKKSDFKEMNRFYSKAYGLIKYGIKTLKAKLFWDKIGYSIFQ